MAKPKYTSKIDVYSYGVLIIHTFCGRWPFPQDAFCPDPQNPDAIIPASEVERRAEYLQEIGNDHPLMAVIRQCLSNVPAQRPEARLLCDQINTILSALPQPYTNRFEMVQQFETSIQTLTKVNQSMQSEIDSLTRRKQSEMKFLKAALENALYKVFRQYITIACIKCQWLQSIFNRECTVWEMFIGIASYLTKRTEQSSKCISTRGY